MSVFFYGCVSLDGCLADRDHGLGWLYETGTVEETGYEEFYREMDVTLMGRRTFRELEAAGDPAAVYPATENYVFTHRPLSREGFTPVCGSVPEFVESLGGDRNIWVVGGNTLLAPLLERDMVDRMIVQIAPVLLGGGVPLFTQGLPLRRFRLDGVRRYGPFAELSYSKA
ncbi:dihydrofolate reductase family protein [uncultured Oscillibacter sp.]|uniref:dihydrofolate reductase family protein n=1 Tax=uncultured Oscillibacter sp. TaxID=876091 RepID=UPI0025E24746|nr:dihydrofolate reductase family protein [uncultured Oscillibacter sp.]